MRTTTRSPGLLAAALTAATIGVALPAAADTWTIETLDAAGDAGRACTLVRDAGGDLHAAYLRGGDLATLSRLMGLWQSPHLVDDGGQVAGDASLAVDGTGATRFAYRGAGTTDLRYAGPESPPVWGIESIAPSPDDRGRYADLHLSAMGGLSAAWQNATLGALEFATRTGPTMWSTPVTVDAGPGRGADAGHVHRAGVGYAFCYRDEIAGALWAADPTAGAVGWQQEMVATAGDVGRYADLARVPGDSLAVVGQDATGGSLFLCYRDPGGSWSPPQTVDPGPQRGYAAAVAHRPGAGVAFVERDSAAGALLFGDPEIQPPAWTRGTIHETQDSGRHVSLVARSDGGFDVAFYHYGNGLLGSIYHAGLDASFQGTVTVVTDSIAVPPDEGAFVALAVDHLDLRHLAFRRPSDTFLWYGWGDGSVVAGVGDPSPDTTPGETPPLATRLRGSYPNPFNPATTIAFELRKAGLVELIVYDVAGRRVRLLMSGRLPAGAHEVAWDGRDDRGRAVASGIYLCRMRVDGSEHTGRMALVR